MTRNDLIRALEVGEIALFDAPTSNEYATIRGAAYAIGRSRGRRFTATRISASQVQILRMEDPAARTDE